MNIYQKLITLKDHIGGFSKDKKSFGYEYVSGSQVLNKIKDKMNELQIFLYPEVDYNTLSWEKHEYLNSRGEQKLDFIVTFKLTYKWINAEDPTDFIEVGWLAVGQQAGDIAKAVGTALTYNERYFLLKTFGLPTDCDDSDNLPLNDASASILRPQPNDSKILEIFALGEAKGLTRPQVLAGCLKDFKKGIEKLNATELKKLKDKIGALNDPV